ncbi:TIM44-like domain-containing protein [Acinetobacter sp.]|uniref:Tim44 domain-containing protein n=1 Tax=Acinetobacter sp. TaxID=472 RepID=UPI0031DBDFBB
MNTRRRGLVASILMATLVVSPLVDAKRVGGGRSHGMTRSVAPSQSYQQTPSHQAAPATTYSNTAPQQKSGSGVGKMVAAGVAGAAVGAIAANAMADDRHAATSNGTSAADSTQQQAQQQKQEKSGLPGWIWIVLIGGIAFFIFRRMSAKKSLATNTGANPYAPNNNGPFGQTPSTPRNVSNDSTNIFGQSVGGNTTTTAQPPFAGTAYTNSGNQLPDGTEPAAFLRIARQRFNHIQSINSASNVEEIRRYLTPDLYNSIYQDIMSNQDQDVAEFSNLNAMVVDSSIENGQYVASVRFTGNVSEDLNSQPKPFSETWHFVKPAGSQQDWLVAGIQVES